MSKTNTLPLTQNLKNQYTCFRSSDTLQVYKAIPNGLGSGMTDGTRTFTAIPGNAGALKSGGTAASWKAPVLGGQVVGEVTYNYGGDYLTAPQDITTNAATADSGGNTSCTWTLLMGCLKTIYTAGANDSVIKAINCINIDAGKTVALILTDASNTFNSILGTITVTTLASYPATTVASFDLLSGTYFPSLPYDANGKRVLPMQANHVLKLAVPAIAAAKFLGVQVFAEDY